MEERADGNAARKSEFARCKDDAPYYSTLDESTSGRSVSACRPPSGRSTPATAARSGSDRSTPGYGSRSTTPEPPPVPPATYHWEEVRRQRSIGGYPWTHLNKPAFDEKTWVKYERDHMYEPVTPAASTDRISARPQPAAKDDGGRHFLRIPLTEELVMADDTGSEPEDKHPRSEEEEKEEEEEDEEEDEKKLSARSDESIYEGENENSSVGETADASRRTPRMKMFQQKVKVKADVLRTKLQGVAKRKPKQKIAVVEGPCNGGDGGRGGGAGEKIRRKFGQFATLPKKFTFNAPKVNFTAAFGNSSSSQPARNSADANESSADDTKSGRFSLPRFGFAKTTSESPKTGHKTAKIGASRLSVPSLRARTWSDASKVSKPASPKPNNRLMDFGTYPRIFSKRRKTTAAAAANSRTQTPPPQCSSGAADAEPSNRRKDSFRRRFFRSHKECTPAPTEEQQTAACTLAVEEDELDETHCVSKESLAEFGDSDLQEVVSLSDDCSRSAKDTKSLSEHRPGVIEEIDSDEFFLREKGLSRGDVHISNYLSSEIRDVFRSNRIVRSVEIVNNRTIRNNENTSNGTSDGADDGGAGTGACTPVRPSRTNSLRRPARYHSGSTDAAASSAVTDRFSTMPKSFGGTRPPKSPEDDVPENIITSRTFEPSNSSALPTAFRVPWRTARHVHDQQVVEHMPPKPPTRQRTSKFSTFDTRSMIDLSRKRSQSQIGFLPDFSDTVPKAPLRRSRASLAGSERDVTAMPDSRPSWSVGGRGAPTPPLRRSRISLAADVEERSTVTKPGGATPPARPPPPQVTAGYATVDKTSLLGSPQSPVRHRRKKSYDMIKSQEFGAFFTIPRSYSYGRTGTMATRSDDDETRDDGNNKLPPPSRPARAYNTLGPSRPLRRRLPVREHEYGDVTDGGGGEPTTGRDEKRQSSLTAARSSSSLDYGDGPAKALCSGDVIEKMKFRPLPSPPAPPRNKSIKAADAEDAPAESHRRRNTDSALVPFLDRRETSATSSNNNNDDDFFADVSRALLASAAKNSVAAAESVGVQTDRLPRTANGYESDDGSCCSSAGSDDRPAASRPWSTAERPVSRTSTTTEYVDRPTSRAVAVENGHAVMLPAPPEATGGGVICAQRISVNELRVGKMTVADIRGQCMGVDRAQIAHFAAACSDVTTAVPTLQETAAAVLPPHNRHLQHHYHHNPAPQDDAVSVQSSRVSSMYPEVDSDEDRASLMGVPTPPRRRSKLATRSSSKNNDDDDDKPTAAAVDPSITELSCQLFRLCHSNVCNVFNKVVQQVVPEDTEKRRDLQAALCFLSIILAGLLILGFGNEKTVHHHHWDFQFPPSNQ